MNTLGGDQAQNGGNKAQIRCIQCGTLNPPDTQTCVICMSSLAASRRATLIGTEAAPTPALRPAEESTPRGGRVSLDPSLLGGGGEMPRGPSRLARLSTDPALTAMPDWYGDLRNSTNSKGLTDPLTEADAETAMPEWLADLTQKQDDSASPVLLDGAVTDNVAAAAPPDAAAPTNADALPPYLAQQVAPLTTDDALPDWLSNLAPAPDSAASDTDTPVELDTARAPDDTSSDWLSVSDDDAVPDWMRGYEGRSDTDLVFSDDPLDLDPFDATATPQPDPEMPHMHDPLTVPIEQIDASALDLPAWLQPELPPRETAPDLLPLPDPDTAALVENAAPPMRDGAQSLDTFTDMWDGAQSFPDDSDALDAPGDPPPTYFSADGDADDTLRGLQPFATIPDGAGDSFLDALTYEPPQPESGSPMELSALPPFDFEIPMLDDMLDSPDVANSLDLAALPPIADTPETSAGGLLWDSGIAPWLRGLYPPPLAETQQDFDDTFGDLALSDLPYIATPAVASELDAPAEHSVDIFIPGKSNDLLPLDVASFDSLDAEAFARFEERTASSFLPPMPDALDDETRIADNPRVDDMSTIMRGGATSPFSLSAAIEAYTDDEDTLVNAPNSASDIASDMPAFAMFGDDADDNDADMPEWLRAMRPGAKPPSSVTATPTPATYSPMGTGGDATFEDENVPSWLRDTMSPQADELTRKIVPAVALTTPAPIVFPLPTGAPTTVSNAEESQDITAASMSDWLPTVAPMSVVQPVAPEPDPAFLALPDWLDEITADDSPAIPAQAAPRPETSLDNLFRSLAAESVAPVPVAESANLPGWLNSQQPPEEVVDVTVPELIAPTDLPDWLQTDSDTFGSDAAYQAQETLPPSERWDTSPTAVAGPEDVLRLDTTTSAPALNFTDLTADFADTRPAWFTRIGDKETQPTVHSVTGVGESPDWLSLVRARAADVDVVAPNPLPPSVRPVDDLPPEPVVLPPRIAGADILRELTDPTETEARVAATAAASEASAATVRRTLRVDRSQILRWAVAAALVAMILLGLLLKPFGTNAPTPSTNSQNFYTALNSLPKAQAKVLVVYDWDVDKMAELAPAARAITQHLMHRAARIVTVSTLPQGAALAVSITDPIATSTNPAFGNNYIYGDQYVHLGYRPAGDVALRGLNGAEGLYSYFGNAKDYTGKLDLATVGALRGVKSLSDFDMVVVLAGDDTALRTWVTQYGTLPAANYVVALPLSSVPTALPILNAAVAQPKGSLLGLQGVAEYVGLLKTDNIDALPDHPLDGRVNAQALAALLLIVLLIGANVMSMMRGRNTR